MSLVSMLAALVPTPAGAQQLSDVDVLARLVAVPGVSGSEGPVRREIRSLLPSWAHPVTDAMGNLVLTVGHGEPRTLFIAHMDEVGFVVSGITPDGYLRLTPVGGFFPETFASRIVNIETAHGVVKGVVATKSIHLTHGAPPPLDQQTLFVDVGADSAAQVARMGIRIYDTVSYEKHLQRLAGTRIAGRSFDDRFGDTTLVQAVRAIDPARVHGTIVFAWSVQEEVGTRGAAAIARSQVFDDVIPVDMFVTSDTPLESRVEGYAPLGKGFVMRAWDQSNISDIALVRRLAAWARAQGIAVQEGVTGGGNDGSEFWSERTKVLPIGIPLRYSHAVEVGDSRDLHGIVRYVEALATRGVPASP
ncbi:MAG TPA: hypothetical protein VNJ51_14510 [Candidatus Dormibacteraeota bacterium]|nr:hypothetical protein [Candidatus Dormibacteraeota bacterium]